MSDRHPPHIQGIMDKDVEDMSIEDACQLMRRMSELTIEVTKLIDERDKHDKDD